MRTGSDLRLESLVDALTWNDNCVTLASEWKDRYLSLLRNRFGNVARSDLSGLLAQAAQLMDGEVESLLTSPRVSWRLLRHVESETVGALQREMLRLLDEGVSDSGEPHEPLLEPGCFCLRGLVVDAQSSYDCPSREPGEAALGRLGPEAEAVAFGLIKDAASLLECESPNICHFVKHFTTRIALRSDPARPNGFASGSFRDHAGLTLIVNPEVLAGDLLKLVDALVHESVHAAIYVYEAVVEPLCREHPSELRVRSCWSGRMLTLDQYVQACFVWWGLLNLWSGWLTDGKNSPSAESLCDRAARGFLSYPASKLQQERHHAYLTDHTWRALLDIERRAVRDVAVLH